MTYDLGVRLAAEFIGTAIMVLLGNGSVANVDLKGTKVTALTGCSLPWATVLG